MALAGTPRFTRNFLAESARRWPSWRLYSTVPRSSQLPSTVTLAKALSLMQAAFLVRMACDSGVRTARSKAKKTGRSFPPPDGQDWGSEVTHLPAWQALPDGQAESFTHSGGGAGGGATVVHFPDWQAFPAGQSSLRSHSGRGTHLSERQTNPALQSVSWPHSWQRPSTQVLPYPSWAEQSSLVLHSPSLGFAGQPARKRA